MRHLGLRSMVLLSAIFATVLGWSGADASTVTFTGTVHYDGPYSGTLYVAVIDTTQADSAQFLDLQSYGAQGPPFDQAYSLSFDNATAPAQVIVAALLDVDGGGVDSVGQGDIVGWYDSNPLPALVSSDSDHNGLHFDLPQAEIHGTVTFAPGQIDAAIIMATSCSESQGAFGRPAVRLNESGTYSMKGIYAGTWCAAAFGSTSIPPFFLGLCFGDPTCANPTPITLETTEIRTGIDFDFTGNVKSRKTTWGNLKSSYK